MFLFLLHVMLNEILECYELVKLISLRLYISLTNSHTLSTWWWNSRLGLEENFCKHVVLEQVWNLSQSKILAEALLREWHRTSFPPLEPYKKKKKNYPCKTISLVTTLSLIDLIRYSMTLASLKERPCHNPCHNIYNMQKMR